MRRLLFLILSVLSLEAPPASAEQFNTSDGANYGSNDSAFKLYWDSTTDVMKMMSAPSGTAGNPITWTEGLSMNTSGQSLLQIGNDAGACTAAKLGRIRYNGTSTWEYCNNATTWTALGGTASSLALSAVTAATGTNSINNGTNAQTWNWALTGAAADAFTFTENTAATGGSGDQSILKAAAIASSTAIPLMVTNLGNGISFRVNDETGDTDATPFIIDSSGVVLTGVTAASQISGGPSAPRLVVYDDIIAVSDGVNKSDFDLYRSRGSISAKTKVEPGDSLGSLRWSGYDGNSFEGVAAIALRVPSTAADTGDGDIPVEMTFTTTPDGSSTSVYAMLIDENGYVGIGTTDPSARLHVAENDYVEIPLFERTGRTGAGNYSAASFQVTYDEDITTTGDRGGSIVFKIKDTGGTAYETANIDFYRDTADDAGALAFSTYSAVNTFAEHMRIRANGNVGIGTTSPQSSLHVPDGKYAQFEDNNAGAPPAGDCDNDAERGRMSIDTTNNRLYVCNGATRGWDYVALTN